MPKKDPRVDAYIEKSAEFARPILKHLRNLFLKASPKIEETIKWGVPSFEYKGMLGGMAAFKQHVTVGFWKATLMKDPAKLFTEGAGGGFSSGRLTSLDDLPPDDVLLAYIHEAMDLNDRDIKLPRTKPAKNKSIVVPADLQAALKRSKQAREAFEAFSYSHRKEYVQWITEAKRDETRQRRIQQAIEMLSEGKSMNWRYEKSR